MGAAARKASLVGALAGRWSGWAIRLGLFRPGELLGAALETEWEERRVFLWLPAAAGCGVLLYLAADREPVLWLPVLLLLGTGILAFGLRHRPVPFCLAVGAFALCAGFVSAELRSRQVAAPMLDRIRIVKLRGFVDEVDRRLTGARFILQITDGDLEPEHRPQGVRLTTRRLDPLEAGMFVEVTARLLPPSRAALPGGYDFSRDAYFAGIGAVGSALGRIRASVAPARPDLHSRWHMAVDRARNALAERVSQTVGEGDAGAVAAAMVTGKRDLLSQDGREIIREAGIFHIITIAGVQMTLVAGLLYGGIRRLLALSSTLALRYPIKKWSAIVAIAGAVAYDIGTGSRIGTQRALFMTMIMLGAVLVDRRAFTMRNLALAALAVIAVEPEAIAGASFQLSFAAVAALITVQEARGRRGYDDDPFAPEAPRQPIPSGAVLRRATHAWSALLALFVATVFATLATASFMAAQFHELSPYVFIGNPLTLTLIEFFAVPGALVGTFLYPLGLDAWVWHWVGLGIRFVLWIAAHLASAPASTIYLRGFAPWALPCLSLALLSLVIWRTTTMRLTAVPWLLVGLAGAASGTRYDLLVAPTGDTVALRGADAALAVTGRPNVFTTVQ